MKQQVYSKKAGDLNRNGKYNRSKAERNNRFAPKKQET